MPDIAMCQNKSCPSRQDCYRFMAAPTPWYQSYMDFKPAPGADRCDDFQPLWRPSPHSEPTI